MMYAYPRHTKANSLPTSDINPLIKYGIFNGAMHHNTVYCCGGF